MSRNEICKLVISTIKTFISSNECLETHRYPRRFVRKRRLSFIQVIMYLLFTTKASMFQNISGLVESLGSESFPNISKQALSKARQGIKPSLFQEIFQISVDLFYKHITNRKLWHNYHIFAIDGTKLQLPNSTSNFAQYGEMFSKKNPKRRWTMALGSVVYDVLDDYVVHCSINRYLASERCAAIEHLKVLEALGIYDNSIVIFDRGYYSENLFRYCVSHGHLCVMRLRERYKIAKSCRGDTVVTLAGNPKDGTGDISIRVIEVTLDTGEKEYLGTNVFDKDITRDMFQELYFLRWPVETKYHELKHRLNIEEFSGATSIAIQQEFFINLLISNLASLIKNQADESIDACASPTNKYRYQSNRSFIIGRMKDLLPKIIFGLKEISVIDDLLQQACRNKSQIQPGRKNKRPKKSNRRERSHFNNRKRAV